MTVEKLKSALLAAARAFDARQRDEGRAQLAAAPLVRADRSVRLIALALWRRLLLGEGVPDDGGGVHASDGTVSTALDAIERAVKDPRTIWDAYHALKGLEASAGPDDAAAVVATVWWDCVLDADPTVFTWVVELFSRADGARVSEGLEQFLGERRDFVPSYWHFTLFATRIAGGGQGERVAHTARLIRRARRDDLAAIFSVYLLLIRQAPVSEVAAGARGLAVEAQRTRVAEHLAGASFMPGDLQQAVDLYVELADGSDASRVGIALMQARLATAERRWVDVLAFAKLAATDPRYRRDVNLLRAHALARLHETHGAEILLDDVAADPAVSPWQGARTAFIRCTVELVRRGIALPDERPMPVHAPVVGRPLAQSLWVGRRLRWIERLAIKSYLDNGWRFQLYVYDEVENAPDGCEILDASVIIAAKDVFREGGGNSVLHAGSLGAFSDLFRYKLLHDRGGMWTDTDVVNFRTFDPDNCRFISTEINDAGIVTLNGAVMAAPAGDTFMARAYERANRLLSTREEMFFTRIGPYLLAELFVEQGVETFELMPPGFLSPVSWMNTASLLLPHEEIAGQTAFRQATNLHVFTEMWRMFGLGLDAPPDPATYLGHLHAKHFPADSKAPCKGR